MYMTPASKLLELPILRFYDGKAFFDILPPNVQKPTSPQVVYQACSILKYPLKSTLWRSIDTDKCELSNWCNLTYFKVIVSN